MFFAFWIMYTSLLSATEDGFHTAFLPLKGIALHEELLQMEMNNWTTCQEFPLKRWFIWDGTNYFEIGSIFILRWIQPNRLFLLLLFI